MIHDEHPNWRRLRGWDEAESLLPEISVEWDELSLKYPELQGLEPELWSCVYGNVIDVVASNTGLVRRHYETIHDGWTIMWVDPYSAVDSERKR